MIPLQNSPSLSTVHRVRVTNVHTYADPVRLGIKIGRKGVPKGRLEQCIMPTPLENDTDAVRNAGCRARYDPFFSPRDVAVR